MKNYANKGYIEREFEVEIKFTSSYSPIDNIMWLLDQISQIFRNQHVIERGDKWLTS